MNQTWGRTPGQGKYARTECERRFLLTGPPADGLGPGRLIEDRYVHGTRLRLRRITGEGETVYKFCQKVRPDEADPGTVALTNMYLSEVEYQVLCRLPATVLRKTRRPWVFAGQGFAVDEFHDLPGLWLAEIELTAPDQQLVLGPPLEREVTHDERYSGGGLAARLG